MYHQHQSLLSPKTIAWALLSQTIWLPLVAIDAHDHWRASVADRTPPSSTNAVASSSPSTPVVLTPKARTRPSRPQDAARALAARWESSGIVLSASRGSADPLLQGSPLRTIDQQAATASPLLSKGSASSKIWPSSPYRERTATASVTPAPLGVSRTVASRTSPQAPSLKNAFNRSELLGGTLTLNGSDANLDGVKMPPMARAERARWAYSGDPMAPLPQPWRDPMRKAVQQVQPPSGRMEAARVIHVPSTRVTRTTSVPLAVQSDGSVDILSQPDNPAVIQEIKDWSSRQRAPEAGHVAPAVVELHPIADVTGPVATAPKTAPLQAPTPVEAAPAAPAPRALAPAPAAPPVAQAPAAVPAQAPAPEAVAPAPEAPVIAPTAP
jgi:hypothetical protein